MDADFGEELSSIIRLLRPKNVAPDWDTSFVEVSAANRQQRGYFICPSLWSGEQEKIGTFKQAVSNKTFVGRTRLMKEPT